MGIVVIVIGAWIAVSSVMMVFGLALGRAAAIGDNNAGLEGLAREAAGEVDMTDVDRRIGSEDRRVDGRPWAGKAPGRRAEDVLRQDLAEARRALADAEARLGEIEARRWA